MENVTLLQRQASSYCLGRNHLVGELLPSLIHSINNYLAGALANVQVIQEGGYSQQDCNDILRDVEASINGCTNLVARLRSFVKERNLLAISRVDLFELQSDIREFCLSHLNKSGIEVTIENSCRIATVKGNYSLFQQSILETILDASKHAALFKSLALRISSSNELSSFTITFMLKADDSQQASPANAIQRSIADSLANVKDLLGRLASYTTMSSTTDGFSVIYYFSNCVDSSQL